MEAANTFLGKVIDLALEAVKHEIDYIWNCTENVDKLRNEVQKLKDMKGMVQQQIVLAKQKGDHLLDGVQSWIEKADNEISKLEKFLDEEANANKRCFNSNLCLNLGTLRRCSKMATRNSRLLLEIQEDGKPYESCVSIPAPKPSIVDLHERTNLDDIKSHKLTLGEIITALSDETIQIVGIYGIGGVGKTTLAKEVAAEVKNQYAEIVLITVSQTVDLKMIQEKVEVAAKRIMKGDKVLIILDDMWEDLKLSEVGIPCGSGHINCKILLTSRSKNVCEAMNAKRCICVNTLEENEAWIIFKRVVGERLETDNRLNKIAREMVQECGGLPLIIQVLGSTLRSKATHMWEALLNRLQNHAPLDMPPEIKKAFIHLKLSYEYLDSVEAKSCFLLCSLFPEDAMIRLEKLVEYGVGVGIFNNDGLQAARNRARIAVDTLQSVCLLLPSESNDDVFQMHDVVRDVALLIASSNGKDNFLVETGKGLKEWKLRKNTTSESYTKISLMRNDIHELPEHEFHFPLLDTFIIPDNSLSGIPNEFFRGIREVKVLDLSNNHISLLPQSLKLLTKLRTLDLSFNKDLDEISILGELRDLEILKLSYTGIERIPEEIGQLASLRMLHLERCDDLSHITPSVISRLTCLEELYILEWRGYNTDQLCLAELSQLKSFKTLHLKVFFYADLSEGTLDALETLTEFDVEIGHRMNTIYVNFKGKKSHRQRSLNIDYMEIAKLRAMKKLFRVSESISLRFIRDLHNILPDLYEDSFNHLKSISLSNCDNILCLVKTIRDGDAMQPIFGERKTKGKYFAQVEDITLISMYGLELLWDCPHQYISFGSLQTIKIFCCHSLLRLFPLTVAQGLVSLTDIEIEDCDRLVELISASDEHASGVEIEEKDRTDETDAEIVFPRLTNITLTGLPKLKSFYSGYFTVKYPSLKSIRIKDCGSMRRWGYGVDDIPNIKYEGTQWAINDLINTHMPARIINIALLDARLEAKIR